MTSYLIRKSGCIIMAKIIPLFSLSSLALRRAINMPRLLKIVVIDENFSDEKYIRGANSMIRYRISLTSYKPDSTKANQLIW